MERFTGCGTALITPFGPDGAVDLPGLRSLVRRQVQGGVHFVVPCGSTGEAQSLSPEERARVVEATAEAAEGTLGVVAGVSRSDTAGAASEAVHLAERGASAVMVVAPYYVRPTQAGLEAHFRAVADASPVPVLVYTVPGRTGTHLAPDTLLRVAEHPNVGGVKDSTGDLGWALEVLRGRPPGFRVLCGEDGLVLPHLASGGDGVVSVAANVIPATVRALVDATLSGDLARARTLQLRLLPLVRGLFRESNPIPVKAAMSRLGLAENLLRLPLTPALEGTMLELEHAMVELNEVEVGQ